MKVARLLGMGLALLCTAMVSQSRAAVTGLYYDLQVASGGITDSDSYLTPADYTVSANNKTVTFTSNFLSDVATPDPSDQVTITMNVYADVLDAGNQINSYASLSITNTSLGTYHPTAAPTSSTSATLTAPAYATAAYDGYLPSGGSGANHFANFHNNSKVLDSLGDKLASGLGDPYAAVGINQAALSFARTDTTSHLVGTMSAVVDGVAGNKSGTGYTGTPVANSGGGTNLGQATSGGITSNYFVAGYQSPGNANPMSSGFSYLNYSTTNPDPTAVHGVATVTIGGSTYDEVYLGQLAFTFSASNTGAAANINAIPIASLTSSNLPGSYWMQSVDLSSGTATDSTQYTSATLNGYTTGSMGVTAPVSIVTPANGPTPAAGLSLSYTAASTTGRALVGTGAGDGTTVTYTLTNTGNLAMSGGWTTTSSPVSFTPSPATGTALSASTGTTLTGAETSLTVGSQTFTLNVADSTDSLSASTSNTINFVAERSFTNSGISLGRVLAGTSHTNPTAVTSLSSSATTATVTLGAASGTVNGLSLSGAGATFDGNTTSATYTLGGQVTAGPISGTYNIGGTDEFSNTNAAAATVAITGTAVNERSFTAGSPISLGRLLVGSTPTGSTTVSSAALYANTANVTVGSASATSNGVTLSGAGTTFDGSSVFSNTYSLSGAAAAAGAISGTVNVVGTDEFSNSLGTVASLGFTGTAVNERTFTGGSINLGRLFAGTSPTAIGTVATSGDIGTTATVTLGSASGTINGLTLTGEGGTFNSAASTASYSLSGLVSAGVISGTYNINGTDEFSNLLNNVASVSISGTAVGARLLTVGTGGSATTLPANILQGSTWSLTVGGPGSDTSYTNPSLTSTGYDAGNGITFTGVAGTFNAANPNQTINVKFGSAGQVDQTVTAGNLSGLFAKEGLNGETINATGQVTFSSLVGNATAAAGGSTSLNSTSFGTALQAIVKAGATYANLSSTVTGGPAGFLGSQATILDGTNNSGSDAGLSMAWRTRATNELPGNGATFLASDVVQVSGVGSSNGTVDTYVMDVTYNPGAFTGGQSQELANFAAGNLYLGTLNSQGQWVNAVSLDTGETGSLAETHLNETYAQFVSYLNANDAGWTMNEILGSWGVETSNKGTAQAWAVVNHDSEFAVVPEPGTIALLLAGGLAFLPALRRRLKKTA
jgi:hypothetical protein